MRTSLLLLLLLVCCDLHAQVGQLATGHAARLATNRLDIQHRRNDALRRQLMQDAVQDAIERVAPVEVRSNTHAAVHERRSNERTHFTDDFEQRTVQRSRIAWQRIGDFQFQRDPQRYRQWICTVSGTVRGLPVPVEFDTERLALAMDRPMVTRKRGATVQLSLDGLDKPKPGDVLESHRPARTAQGDAGVPRVTGQLVVTEVNDRSATARVVRGYWTARTKDAVRKGHGGILRGGVQLHYTTDAGTMLPAAGEGRPSRPVQALSVAFFEHSLLQRWEVSMGVEAISDPIPGGNPLLSFLPHVRVGRPFALVPEVLYLTPSVGGGYGVLSSVYPAAERALPFFADGLLELSLRLGAVEVHAGARHRIMLGNEHLSGTRPTVGLRLDLYRMTHYQADGRKTPGLATGVRAIAKAAGRLHGR